jgi:hypothetical protein
LRQIKKQRMLFGSLSGLVLLGLVLLTPIMYPMKRGTSQQFWRMATGIDPAGSRKSPPFGHAYGLTDAWFYYELSGFHGSSLRYVPAEEVQSAMPQIVALLQRYCEENTVEPDVRDVLQQSVRHLNALANGDRILPQYREPLLGLARKVEELTRGDEFRQDAHDALFDITNDIGGIASANNEHEPDLYKEMTRVSDKLTAIALRNYVSPWVREGWKAFSGRDNAEDRTAVGLSQDIEKADLERWKRTNPDVYSYRLSLRQHFNDRLARTKWFWATFTFEWLFFSCLAGYVVWPVFRGWDWRRWLLHLSFVPFLLMLPAYFSYAALSFTSAGPTGGILYPWLGLVFRGGGWTRVDQWLVGHLPPVLEPLTQGSGIPMALSGGVIAPTTLLAWPLCAILGAYVAPALWRVAKNRMRVSKQAARST